MTRRPTGPVLAFVIGALLAGCFGAPTYSTTFPADGDPGEVSLDALPVDVIDFTGMVRGVAVAVSDGRPFGPVRAEAKGDVIHVEWTGGACESRVRLVLSPTDRGFALLVKSDSSIGGMLGCPAVGIPRTVDIQLGSSIEGKPIVASIDYP